MPPVSLQRVYSSCLLLTWPVSCVNIYLTPADEPGTQRKPHTEVMTFEGRENPSVLSAEAPPQSLFLEGLWGRGCVFDEEPPLSPCSGSLFFLVAGCHLQPLPPPSRRTLHSAFPGRMPPHRPQGPWSSLLTRWPDLSPSVCPVVTGVPGGGCLQISRCWCAGLSFQIPTGTRTPFPALPTLDLHSPAHIQ